MNSSTPSTLQRKVQTCPVIKNGNESPAAVENAGDKKKMIALVKPRGF